jgi:hypothetical protein
MKVTNFCEKLGRHLYRNKIIYTFTDGTPPNIFIFAVFFKKKGDKTENNNFREQAKNRFSRTVPLDFK